MRLDGKVAVITGASRGIGRKMAADFSAAGARVVVAARNASALESLVAEIGASGGDAHAIQADIGRMADCAALMEGATARYGQIDVLVNNAALSGPAKFVRDLEPAEWEEIIRVNLTGVYACIHFAVGQMMERKSGAIVNISSFNGKYPMGMRSAYASSKLGIVGLTRGLAKELGPFGIRVNTISPGPVEGERVDEVIERMAKSGKVSEEQVREGLLGMSPLHGMATADDISRMALFLASDWGRHMTGQDINITAGIVMY